MRSDEMQKVMQEYEAGHYNEVERLTKKLLIETPSSTELYELLGVSLQAQKK